MFPEHGQVPLRLGMVAQGIQQQGRQHRVGRGPNVGVGPGAGQGAVFPGRRVLLRDHLRHLQVRPDGLAQLFFGHIDGRGRGRGLTPIEVGLGKCLVVAEQTLLADDLLRRGDHRQQDIHRCALLDVELDLQQGLLLAGTKIDSASLGGSHRQTDLPIGLPQTCRRAASRAGLERQRARVWVPCVAEVAPQLHASSDRRPVELVGKGVFGRRSGLRSDLLDRRSHPGEKRLDAGLHFRGVRHVGKDLLAQGNACGLGIAEGRAAPVGPQDRSLMVGAPALLDGAVIGRVSQRRPQEHPLPGPFRGPAVHLRFRHHGPVEEHVVAERVIAPPDGGPLLGQFRPPLARDTVRRLAANVAGLLLGAANVCGQNQATEYCCYTQGSHGDPPSFVVQMPKNSVGFPVVDFRNIRENGSLDGTACDQRQPPCRDPFGQITLPSQRFPDPARPAKKTKELKQHRLTRTVVSDATRCQSPPMLA